MSGVIDFLVFSILTSALSGGLIGSLVLLRTTQAMIAMRIPSTTTCREHRDYDERSDANDQEDEEDDELIDEGDNSHRQANDKNQDRR